MLPNALSCKLERLAVLFWEPSHGQVSSEACRTSDCAVFRASVPVSHSAPCTASVSFLFNRLLVKSRKSILPPFGGCPFAAFMVGCAKFPPSCTALVRFLSLPADICSLDLSPFKSCVPFQPSEPFTAAGLAHLYCNANIHRLMKQRLFLPLSLWFSSDLRTQLFTKHAQLDMGQSFHGVRCVVCLVVLALNSLWRHFRK